MKKTATLIGAFALSLLSFEGYSQMKLGVKAGVNVTNFGYDLKDSEDQEFVEDNSKSKIGYHVGLAAEFGLSDNFALQSGLMWTNKGSKMEYNESEEDFEIDVKQTISLNYLEVPVNLAFKANNFQVFAGPYVAFGLAGKTKYESTLTFMGETESEKDELDVKFKNTVEESDFEDSEDTEFVRALDYGLNFGLGYTVGPVLLSANYSLGLGNLNPDFEGAEEIADDNKMTNKGFGISATYFFGGK